MSLSSQNKNKFISIMVLNYTSKFIRRLEIVYGNWIEATSCDDKTCGCFSFCEGFKPHR